MPTSRWFVAPIVAMFWILPACKGPFFGPHAYTGKQRRPHKQTAQDVARVMVEKDTYLVVSPQKREVLVRRCAARGEHDDCDVAWLVDRSVRETFRVTTFRAGVPTALAHALAEPITARIKRMKGHVLNVRGRNVPAGELYGLEAGSSYQFELDEERLRIVYRPDSEALWGTQVADVRVNNAAATLSSFITHDAYGLFALQLRHESKGEASTSWLMFERQDPGPGGILWTIESTTGEHATVVSSTPERIRIGPTNAPPAAPQEVPPPPTGRDLPQVDPTPPRSCEDANECEPGETCASPESRLWNHCGAQMPPSCQDGFISDGCGHCFAGCVTDAECGKEKHCNGSWCESPTVCATDEPPPM